jgi:ABC-type antimicrobial peptide transport system permease subunit
LQSIFSRVALQVGIGMLVGLAAAVTLEAPITSAIGWSELAGRRAIVIPAIALLMLLAGFLAAFGPARRGLSIQPIEALKAE